MLRTIDKRVNMLDKNVNQLTRRVIITGGPGTGKSTLLEQLRQAGFSVFEEVSRRLIQTQSQQPTPALPWTNLPLFAEICLEQMLEQYNTAQPQRLNFYDRAIPDIIAYLRNGGVEVPPKYAQVLQDKPYDALVFFAPPWQQIYVNDQERPQTYEESLQIADLLKETYQQLGYRLITLPKASCEARVAFVREKVVELR
jgi:predicted ATPase